MTGIHGGERVLKMISALKLMDVLMRLNAVIGIVRSFLPQEHEWQSLLFQFRKT